MCNNGELPKVPLKLHILIIIKHRVEAQLEEGSATVKYCQIYWEQIVNMLLAKVVFTHLEVNEIIANSSNIKVYNQCVMILNCI